MELFVLIVALFDWLDIRPLESGATVRFTEGSEEIVMKSGVPVAVALGEPAPTALTALTRNV